jgi:UDP-3-O-acyl N-acetylglucosamine deacetylase
MERVEDDILKGAKVLIIDDEPGICRELEKLFEESGSVVSSLNSAERLFEALEDELDLVLLDIWIPGRDGMEVLQELQALNNPPCVIMMSGHATIATAVKATQMGAYDFLEKPLDIELTLERVRAGLHAQRSGSLAQEGWTHAEPKDSSEEAAPGVAIEARDSGSGAAHLHLNIQESIFGKQPWAGECVQQRTIQHSIILYGTGLHSGKKSGMSLEPLPPDSGIHFVGVSGGPAVPAHVDFVDSTGFATTLKSGGSSVQTIEHLMSALHALGISNLLVKCNEEVPILDGSSLEFLKAIREVGVCEQSGEWYAITPPERIIYDNGTEQISIEPADRLTVEYYLNYPAPLGEQELVYTHHSIEHYEKEISPARTFGFVQDVGYLQAKGLAQGGRMDNFILYGKDGALNQSLRFENEAVRHKILDAIGDLYLLGRPLQAKITARMTGHSDNIGLLELVRDGMPR